MPLLQVLHTQLLVDATLGKGQKLGSPSRAQPSVLLTIMMDATPQPSGSLRLGAIQIELELAGWSEQEQMKQ